MTVCVAAIAERNTVIGVSDRMITAGDVEFEPGQAKMWALSTSIWALVAGDMTVQAELLKQVNKETQQQIVSQPDEWLSVKDVALLYCKKYRELLRQRAEAEILHPVGLDVASFLAKQASMQADVVMSLADQLAAYDFPDSMECIFLGIDKDGPISYPSGEELVYPQLYVTRGDKLSWLTSVGFAAIGIGKGHAESQFMFSGHWPMKPFHETALLALAAKKRAEVAPGVGKDTDMIVIGPALGSALKVEHEHVEGLQTIYEKSRDASDAAIKHAQEEAKEFVEKVRAEYAKQRKEKGSKSAQSSKEKKTTRSVSQKSKQVQ